MARLDTFQQEFNLTTNELDQLQRQLNIVKLEDFLQADALDIANCTELGAQDFMCLKQNFLKKYRTKSKSVWATLKESIQSNFHESTCLLDLLVSNGQCIEVKGSSGAGKTQLMMWATIQTLIRQQSVVYLDADNGLCADRMFELFQQYHPDPQVNSCTTTFCHLHVAYVRDLYQLLQTLRLLATHAKFANTRLLVIDSINAALTAHLLQRRCSDEHDIVFHVTQSIVKAIDRLFQNRSLPFTLLITNNGRNLFGSMWSNRIDQQVLLSRSDCNEESIDLTHESSFAVKNHFVFKISENDFKLLPKINTNKSDTPTS